LIIALLDTSAIVAAFDRSEAMHQAAATALGAWKGELVTVEAVIAESCHLLRKIPGAREAILRNVASDVFHIPMRLPDAARHIEQLFAKYHGQQISLADACLIHLAGELSVGDIFTLDEDFTVYRWGHNRAFRLLIQKP
jgi:uncharacterized protein